MNELLNLAGSLGVGAFLGLIMFFVYRYDRYRSMEDRKFMEDRLTSLLEKDQESRQDNTKVLSELVTVISRLNGKD